MRATARAVRAFRVLRAWRLAGSISAIERGKITPGLDPESVLAMSSAAAAPGFFVDAETCKTSLGKVLLNGDEYIAAAEDIMRHEFDLLGSGKKDVSETASDTVGAAGGAGGYRRIDWHRDFKSGMEWERDIPYVDIQTIKGGGSDIIVPWELSCFHHLPTLGMAYWITNDERYAQEFIDQVCDWISGNPPLYGVNWACPMEAAIRAVNWIWGYCFFAGSPWVSEGFLAEFLKSLYIHGKYIRANLERPPRLAAFVRPFLKYGPDLGVTQDVWRGARTNHYLCDLAGLFYLGTLFSGTEGGEKWRTYAVKELIREMRVHVYRDGVDYEGSISYHRLVTELFLSATILGSRSGTTFPGWYLEKLEKMVEFTAYYTKPDGTAPQVGDNDDGRLHILEGYAGRAPDDHRHLLAVGSALFDRPDLAHAAGGYRVEAFLLTGEEGDADPGEAGYLHDHLSSRGFPLGGYYVMRHGSLYMIVDCVPADPRAPSSHKHNSRLGFELFAYDKSFIVDPGAYVYTADPRMRNAFRSTRYHNTISVDGREQNRFDEGSLFDLEMDAAVLTHSWEVGEERDLLDAEHHGYGRLEKPVTHRRKVLFLKRRGYWIVKDILTGEGSHRFDLYFHLAPIDAEAADGVPLAFETRTKGANLAIVPLETDGLSAELEEGWVSFRYGVKERAPVVRYSKEGEAPVVFCSVLCPYVAEIDIDKIAEEASGFAKVL